MTTIKIPLSVLNPQLLTNPRPIKEGSAYCCQCGRLIEPQLVAGHVKLRRCNYHTWSKMMPPGFITRAFASMRKATL